MYDFSISLIDFRIFTNFQWEWVKFPEKSGNERSRISSEISASKVENFSPIFPISKEIKIKQCPSPPFSHMAMIHDIVFLWIWLYLYLFVNSPSPLLVSEAGHQKGRENKSGPARHCLSYITLHCTLHVAHCTLNETYCTAKPFLYHTSLHIAH